MGSEFSSPNPVIVDLATQLECATLDLGKSRAVYRNSSLAAIKHGQVYFWRPDCTAPVQGPLHEPLPLASGSQNDFPLFGKSLRSRSEIRFEINRAALNALDTAASTNIPSDPTQSPAIARSSKFGRTTSARPRVPGIDADTMRFGKYRVLFRFILQPGMTKSAYCSSSPRKDAGLLDGC